MGYTGTTNYGFQKPAKENAFTVDDLNNALDKIDETIKTQSDSTSSGDSALADRITAVEQKNVSQDSAIAGKQDQLPAGTSGQVWTSTGVEGEGKWSKSGVKTIYTGNISNLYTFGTDSITIHHDLDIMIHGRVTHNATNSGSAMISIKAGVYELDYEMIFTSFQAFSRNTNGLIFYLGVIISSTDGFSVGLAEGVKSPSNPLDEKFSRNTTNNFTERSYAIYV